MSASALKSIKSIANIQIDDYLEKKAKYPGGTKGNCKTCGTLVNWNREKLSSHKRANCNIQDTKFWRGN